MHGIERGVSFEAALMENPQVRDAMTARTARRARPDDLRRPCAGNRG